MSAPRETPAANPPGRRTRFFLGLTAWLWLAGLVSLLMLMQALHVRTRALLFFAGLLVLIRLLGWVGQFLRPGGR